MEKQYTLWVNVLLLLQGLCCFVRAILNVFIFYFSEKEGMKNDFVHFESTFKSNGNNKHFMLFNVAYALVQNYRNQWLIEK